MSNTGMHPLFNDVVASLRGSYDVVLRRSLDGVVRSAVIGERCPLCPSAAWNFGELRASRRNSVWICANTLRWNCGGPCERLAEGLPERGLAPMTWAPLLTHFSRDDFKTGSGT